MTSTPDVPALVADLAARRLTVAVAESLTGGLVLAELTAIPGASAVVRGGSVVYMTDTKQQMLGVPDALLAERGPVDAEVARAMAAGARRLWGADLGLATTGVAGPDPQHGHPVGEVHIAVAHAHDVVVQTLNLTGDRAEIRRETVARVLGLMAEVLVASGGGEALVGRRGYTEVTQGEERR